MCSAGPEDATNRHEVRDALDLQRVRPSKRLGQNFLVDERVIGDIRAVVLSDDPPCVVEIGPGLGALTKALATAVDRLIAVEIDPRLADGLRHVFREVPNVEVVTADFQTVDLAAIADTCGSALHVVGSIPYSITAPILKKLVRERAAIADAVLITQREVAEKIARSPGREGTALGVYVRSYAEVEPIRRIPPGAFHPVPGVDSMLWRLRFLSGPRFSADPGDFFSLVRAIYGARRKMLRKVLASHVGPSHAAAALQRSGIDGTIRGETLGFAQLDALANGLRPPE